MNQQFEDVFMDIQSELISLCLEVTEKKVDKIYAYASIEKSSKMFNAFFSINGKIKTLNQIEIDNSLIMQFLKLGTADLDKIKDVCIRFNRPAPTELKMYYDVNSGKYDADYKYDPICSAETGIGAGEIFMNWMAEIKSRGEAL